MFRASVILLSLIVSSAPSAQANDPDWIKIPLQVSGAQDGALGLWTSAELAEASGAGMSLHFAEIPTPEGTILFSYQESTACGVSNCYARVGLITLTDRYVAPDPIRVCQAPETLEMRAAGGIALRMCGQEFISKSSFDTAIRVPIAGSGVHPLFGTWGTDRLCGATAPESYFEMTAISQDRVEAEYYACTLDISDGQSAALPGVNSWTGQANCPYENEPAKEFDIFAVSSADTLSFGMTAYEDGRQTIQKLYRCLGAD